MTTNKTVQQYLDMETNFCCPRCNQAYLVDDICDRLDELIADGWIEYSCNNCTCDFKVNADLSVEQIVGCRECDDKGSYLVDVAIHGEHDEISHDCYSCDARKGE